MDSRDYHCKTHVMLMGGGGVDGGVAANGMQAPEVTLLLRACHTHGGPSLRLTFQKARASRKPRFPKLRDKYNRLAARTDAQYLQK